MPIKDRVEAVCAGSKKQREPATTGRTEAKEALAKPDEDSEIFLHSEVCLTASVNTRVSL